MIFTSCSLRGDGGSAGVKIFNQHIDVHEREFHEYVVAAMPAVRHSGPNNAIPV
jgi:hypothetical protein